MVDSVTTARLARKRAEPLSWLNARPAQRRAVFDRHAEAPRGEASPVRTAIRRVVHDRTVDESGWSGADLARRYFSDVVRPILAERFARLPHAAGRLGSGSDVLGFDDETSQDHDWGLRLSLFVPADAVREVDRELERRLPETFEGLPTRFAFTGQTGRRQRVDVASVSGFLDARLGFDPRANPSVADWLSLTGQAALEVTAGPVFVDTDGGLTAARAALRWYPEDVWRYVLASDWIRLAQELPLMSRAADVGDDVGSCIIAARLTQITMHLAFMLERRWPPYAKWFGTSFDRLACAKELGDALSRTLHAHNDADRQSGLARALESLLRKQNSLGLTAVTPALVPFWDRPHIHPNPAIATQLLKGITHDRVKTLPHGHGSAEQRTDNVDILVNARARARLVAG